MKHWHILSYLFITPIFLLGWIVLTITNTFPACPVDFHVGQIILGTFGVVLTSRRSGHAGTLLALSSSLSDSTSAVQWSSLSSGFLKSTSQLSQYSVSEMLSDTLSLSHWTGWQLICLIQRIFNIWVRPPGRSFADNARGKGDLPDNWNVAAPSCWKSDQNALTISSVSEMYPTAVIGVFWARDSFCVAHRSWLPCHVSKRSWTLAILCNVRCSTSFFSSESFCVFVVSNTGSVPANIPLLAWANCLTTTFSRTRLPVVFECFQRTTSRPKEWLASTPTPGGMIENMSRATLDRSAQWECDFTCW